MRWYLIPVAEIGIPAPQLAHFVLEHAILHDQAQEAPEKFLGHSLWGPPAGRHQEMADLMQSRHKTHSRPQQKLPRAPSGGPLPGGTKKLPEIRQCRCLQSSPWGTGLKPTESTPSHRHRAGRLATRPIPNGIAARSNVRFGPNGPATSSPHPRRKPGRARSPWKELCYLGLTVSIQSMGYLEGKELYGPLSHPPARAPQAHKVASHSRSTPTGSQVYAATERWDLHRTA